MDISINARVNCSDGPCGESTRVILKPTSEEITHLVVDDDGFPDTEYMVSIAHVAESTPSQIQLDCSREQLSEMPVIDRLEYVPSTMLTLNGNPYSIWPYYVPVSPNINKEKDLIPADELTIRRGARVEAADGHIGRVDEFLINPEDDRITHLVMREGHLWGQKDVTIPVDQIDHYQDNIVYLRLKKQEIEKLPALPIRRGKTK